MLYRVVDKRWENDIVDVVTLRELQEYQETGLEVREDGVYYNNILRAVPFEIGLREVPDSMFRYRDYKGDGTFKVLTKSDYEARLAERV